MPDLFQLEEFSQVQDKNASMKCDFGRGKVNYHASPMQAPSGHMSDFKGMN